MHGFLWNLHADHHKKDHDSWFERNDAFFIIYAIISMGFFFLWRSGILDIGLAVGLGIFAYGFAYFMVHDIFIHQRFKMFRNANNVYAKAVRRVVGGKSFQAATSHGNDDGADADAQRGGRADHDDFGS